MPRPDWWLLMAGRGVPFHPDVQASLQMAKDRVAVYNGAQPVLTEQARLVVQTIVIDALNVAPQPVTRGWTNTSLMAVGGLVRWALLTGEPLDRTHLMSEHTRNRFLNLGCRNMRDTSIRNYRCRLDLIATGLSGIPIQPSTTRRLYQGEPVDPHTDDDIATLWAWAQGLRPEKRRDRVTATIVLGLGCGLPAKDHVRVRPEHVTVDPDGVHVTIHPAPDTEPRTITCAEPWADQLAERAAATPPGHLLNSPWRTQPATPRMLQNVLRAAQTTTPAPVPFSARSLRNTWLVHRLTSGTPIPTLLDAAGVTGIEALKPFLPFVPAPTPADRALSLRRRP